MKYPTRYAYRRPLASACAAVTLHLTAAPSAFAQPKTSEALSNMSLSLDVAKNVVEYEAPRSVINKGLEPINIAVGAAASYKAGREKGYSTEKSLIRSGYTETAGIFVGGSFGLGCTVFTSGVAAVPCGVIGGIVASKASDYLGNVFDSYSDAIGSQGSLGASQRGGPNVSSRTNAGISFYNQREIDERLRRRRELEAAAQETMRADLKDRQSCNATAKATGLCAEQPSGAGRDQWCVSDMRSSDGQTFQGDPADTTQAVDWPSVGSDFQGTMQRHFDSMSAAMSRLKSDDKCQKVGEQRSNKDQYEQTYQCSRYNTLGGWTNSGRWISTGRYRSIDTWEAKKISSDKIIITYKSISSLDGQAMSTTTNFVPCKGS